MRESIYIFGFFLVCLVLGSVVWISSPSSPRLQNPQKPALEILTDVSKSSDHVSLFHAWRKAHKKEYSAEEEKRRFENFQASILKIQQHNSAGSTYRMGLTEYADFTDEEFMEHFGLNKKLTEDCSATSTKPLGLSALKLPESIDWRDLNGVSPVKNQGHCGSCWTFSTTGCLEAHYLLQYKELLDLSEQQLLDCAGNYDNHGCNGGLPSHAYEYILENGGLQLEKNYPYHASDESCKKPGFFSRRIKVRSVFNITQYDENELKVAVGSVGPVSVAFQVAGDFRLYTSGVYSSSTCGNKPSDVNHAVLAVGYGNLDGVDYWIIKNSWGASWGMKGFFLMQRGVNMCGVSDCASFPILA